jgi:putative zinc finger/helix-turn-helix YgiT family protein
MRMSNVHESDRHCLNCGLADIEERQEEQEFAYGIGDEQVILKACYPVFICPGCEFAFSDERGEIARHAAVCSHLGVLNPAEIIAIRQDLDLSRNQFAELIGVGIASLQRWETGSQIQSKSNDNLLRLMRNRENLLLLTHIEVVSGSKIGSSISESSKPKNCRNLADFSRLPNKVRLESVARIWKLRRS